MRYFRHPVDRTTITSIPDDYIEVDVRGNPLDAADVTWTAAGEAQLEEENEGAAYESFQGDKDYVAKEAIGAVQDIVEKMIAPLRARLAALEGPAAPLPVITGRRIYVKRRPQYIPPSPKVKKKKRTKMKRRQVDTMVTREPPRHVFERTFGRLELEEAAWRIAYLSWRDRISLRTLRVHAARFTPGNSRDGFLELVDSDWLIPVHDNPAVYQCSPSLIRRLADILR